MSEIIIYRNKENQIQVDVSFEGETFWLSLNQMATLFERDKSVISRHLKNIFHSHELDRIQLLQKCNNCNYLQPANIRLKCNEVKELCFKALLQLDSARPLELSNVSALLNTRVIVIFLLYFRLKQVILPCYIL